MDQDISKYTGEENYKRPPKNIVAPEVSLQGKDGAFIYSDLPNRQKGQAVAKTTLGPTINAVFLVHRQRLHGYDKRLEKFTVSTEYKNRESRCFLFGKNETGVAGDLREKYDSILETQHLIYAFLLRPDTGKREFVRMIVRGAQLGSQNTPEGVTKLYDYLSKFDKSEHSYEFVTKMTAVKETGSLGPYYVINFEKGAKLDEVKLKSVKDEIVRIGEIARTQDEFYAKNDPVQTTREAELPVIQTDDRIEYPSEEINPDDIPF